MVCRTEFYWMQVCGDYLKLLFVACGEAVEVSRKIVTVGNPTDIFQSTERVGFQRQDVHTSTGQRALDHIRPY